MESNKLSKDEINIALANNTTVAADPLLSIVGKNIKDTDVQKELDCHFEDITELLGNINYATKNLRTQNFPIVWASGNYFADSNGQFYIDVCAQTQNLNFGHNHPDLINAAVESLLSKEPYYTSSKFGNIPALKLSEKLREFLPDELNRVNLKMVNGADAVETALKCSLKYHSENGDTDRVKIVSFNWAHHGHTMKTMACTNKYAHISYVPLEDHIHIDVNDMEQMRTTLKKENGVAAFILEPILMNGGAVPVSQEYMDEVGRICKEEDIVLIFDEVQTGFGWTGTMFGLEHYSVVPDIICLSKSIASGFPCSACVMKDKFDNLDFGEAEFTAGMNAAIARVALKNIELLSTTKVMKEVEMKADYFNAGLEEMQEKYPQTIKNITGIGLMIGVETDSSETAETVYKNALKRGFLLRVSKDGKGETIIMKPSLNTTFVQIDAILKVLEYEIQALQA